MRYITHLLLSEVHVEVGLGGGSSKTARFCRARETRDPFGVDHTCCWCSIFTSPTLPSSHKLAFPPPKYAVSSHSGTPGEIELSELSRPSSRASHSSRAGAGASASACHGASEGAQQQPWPITAIPSPPSLPTPPPQAHLRSTPPTTTASIPRLPPIQRHSLNLKIPHLMPNRSETSTPKSARAPHPPPATL